MECPYCEGTDQQKEQPFEDDDEIVKRRINCENCGKHYYLLYQQYAWQDNLRNDLTSENLN